MDPLPDGVMKEFLEIARRAEGDHEGKDAARQVQWLPRTSADFEGCKFRQRLCQQLQARLGDVVDEALVSDELELDCVDGIRPGSIEKVLARLMASPLFVGVVDDARVAVEKAVAGVRLEAPAASANANASGGGSAFSDATGGLLRRNVDALSTSDTEREGMHAKKRTARRHDWVGMFDLSGGGLWGSGAGGLSPRVDIEAALEALESGLNSPVGSAAGVVEALGLLAEADPELFNFGNNWPPFLKLARRALDSPDSTIQAKALILHWVMYEKSMGMNAADMCEGVLAHAQRYFNATVHLLADPAVMQHGISPTTAGAAAASAKLMVVGNSELAFAAREARALHGMISTIHEAFQHLPEKRVWSIVRSFFHLFGDAVVSLEQARGGPKAHKRDADASAAFLTAGSGDGGVDSAVPSGSRSPPAPPSQQRVGDLSSTVLLPAHFLAVAGGVDDWLPAWLRSLPTGRLVRAVNEAGLWGVMARRCGLLGRIPFRMFFRSCEPDAAASSSSGADLGTLSSPSVSAPSSARPHGAASIVRHRLSISAGFSGATCSSGGSAAPLGRALWLAAAELERSLLLQSISFLGILATHCRGAPRPCPPPPPDDDDDDDAGGDNGLPTGDVEREAVGGEGMDDGSLERGKEALRALVQCTGRSKAACRPGCEFGASRSRRKAPAAARGDPRCVRCVALRYVGQLARSTAGGESTPFTPPAIERLFTPLGRCTRSTGEEGRGESIGPRKNNGRGSSYAAGCETADKRLLPDETHAFLEGLAEVAGVLLSSRAASAGFFVDGPAGPRASSALTDLARCAADLAWRACGRWEVDGGDSMSLEGHSAGDPDRPFESLDPEDSDKLAVDFACALAPVAGILAPRLRAAGWAALWQCGVPQALAALVAKLGGAGREAKASTRRRTGREQKKLVGRRGGDLCDRLLQSLTEWAQDLAGVNCLRRVGLADPCAAFLSRELGRLHLDRSSRDACADPRPLALAMRLALNSDSLGVLLTADGGMTAGMNAGLDHLDELMNLPELMQSQTADLPPPHLLGVRTGGGDGARRPGNLAGMELGSDAGDLRCLDFVCRIFISGAVPLAFAPVGPGTEQMKRWLCWALSRVLRPAGASAGAGSGPATSALAEANECGDTQDVRLAALDLVANLAGDLSTAVTIEAESSLVEALAREKSREGPIALRAANDAGVRGEAAGGEAVAMTPAAATTAAGAGVGAGPSCNYDDGGGGGGGYTQGVGGIFSVPDIVDPGGLCRARLAVSLAWLGGPNEERHRLLRKLREAEASAAGFGYARHAVPVRVAGSYTRRMSEGVEFPDDGASDEDWWAAADRCVPLVVALLATPGGGTRGEEGFGLLRKAAARRPLCSLLPNGAKWTRTPGREAAGGARPRRGRECSDSARGGDPSESSRRAVMGKLCFSYARSLGLVDDAGFRDQFVAGFEATLAAAAAAEPPAEPPSPPPPPGCDWFTAVVFLASGADSAAASAMLQEVHRHATRAVFLLPLAGARYAMSATLESADIGSSAAMAGGSAESGARDAAGATNGSCASLSPPLGGGASTAAAAAAMAAAAYSPCEDPPLLLLVALVDEMLEEELPLMSAALKNSGWASAPLAARWMRQCMLCVVDWPGVVAYLTLALLRGYDYQMYFVVALFRAAEPRVTEAASRGLDLMPLLGGGEALDDFDWEESLTFMEGLERRHRPRCVAAARAYLAR